MRERQGQRESELAGLSEHLVSVPAATLSARKGGGDEREFIGPLLSADGCAHTHKHSLRTHALIISAAAAASHTESQTSLSRCMR